MKVNLAYRPYIESDKRINVLWGGRYSAKSYEIAQKKVLRLISNDYAKELVFRKNYISNRESTYETIKAVIFSEGYENIFRFKVAPLEITCTLNGNKIIFRGLNNEEDRQKLKSIINVTGAWIEEAQEFDREDFTAVNLIVRGEYKIKKEIDVSFNPIDEELWMKDRFFDNPPDKGNIFNLNTTYKDNAFLDKEYARTLELLINEDENLYNVYVKGMWGRFDVRGKIYKRWSPANVQEWKYNNKLPIIIACDFNVDPMKWALIQEFNGTDYVFDEVIQMDTDTESMIKEVVKRYGNTQYQVYGDYSGTFRHTSSRTTDYEIIRQYIPRASFYTKPNPLVIDRINAVNWRLLNKQGQRRLFISPKCVNVIHDFKNARFKKGTREEEKADEKYDGKNPKLALIHITSAIGYYIEYKYGLKGRVTTIIKKAF